jgi:hypothetical protein
MSDDVDIRSGGLVAVDTDALRELSGALGPISARLDEVAEALAGAGTASLAAGLWVPDPAGRAREAHAIATDLSRTLDTLAQTYDLAEKEALHALHGTRDVDVMQLAARGCRPRGCRGGGEAARGRVDRGPSPRHRGPDASQRPHARGVRPARTRPDAADRRRPPRRSGHGARRGAPLRPGAETASVEEISTHLATGADAAPRGLVDVIDRMPGQDGLDDARVRVEEYRYASGEREFVAYIAGTRAAFAADEPWDMTSNLQLYFGAQSSSYLAVERALTAAGAVAGDRVHVFSHSQGGMIAAYLARDGDFDVVTEVSFGSPVQAEQADGVLSVAVRHTDDPVAALAVGGFPGVSGSATASSSNARPIPCRAGAMRRSRCTSSTPTARRRRWSTPPPIRASRAARAARAPGGRGRRHLDGLRRPPRAVPLGGSTTALGEEGSDEVTRPSAAALLLRAQQNAEHPVDERDEIAATTPSQKLSTVRPQPHELVTHAVIHSSSPLMTNEMSPSVRMYSGIATILITVPMIVLTSAKIAATASSVSTSCRVSPGANGVTPTRRAGMSVTTQMAKALTTTRTMKRMVLTVFHADAALEGFTPGRSAPRRLDA